MMNTKTFDLGTDSLMPDEPSVEWMRTRDRDLTDTP